MSTVVEKQAHRLKYLQHLYDVANGDTHAVFDMFEVGGELGFPKLETEQVVQYLVDEGLVNYFALGGAIVITHRGRVEVEQSQLHPNQPTEHFSPAAINIVNINNMTNSNFMQGSPGSTQTLTINSNQIQELQAKLPKIKQLADQLEVDESKKQEAKADIATLEMQIASPNPKQSIIKETLLSLRRIAESALGGVAAHALLALLAGIII